MLKKTKIACSVLALGTVAFASALHAQGKPQDIVTVVKITGISWFNRMEVGVKEFGASTPGVATRQIGPAQSDAAQQQRLVEDLVAKKVDAIAVVSMDPPTLEPVLKRAMERGIKVVTHESPDQKYNDWDFELTTAEGYGGAHMDLFAKLMGGEGKYIVYVGSLTVPLHNLWADFAIKEQKEKFPNMQLVADRFGVAESVDDSYKTALDQMRAHPDLKGILTFGSQGPIGAARALEERGKEKSIVLVGGFSPGQGVKYVKDGTIRGGFIWNPLVAGEVFVRLSTNLVKGQVPTDGMEIADVGKVHVDPAKRLVLAQKLESLDKENIDRLVAMGL